MTVLIEIPSQSYAPQTANLAFSVASPAAKFRITLTHPDWPLVNKLIEASVVWAGSKPELFSTGGTLAGDTTRTSLKPAGVTSGTVRIKVFQTLTTALLVESI
jgi:hypothetical protein